MEPVSYTELNSLWQGSPGNYQAARRLRDLGEIYANVQNQKRQKEMEEIDLRNQLARRVMPSKVEQEEAAATSAHLANRAKGVDVNIAEATQGHEIEARRMELFNKISTSELGIFANLLKDRAANGDKEAQKALEWFNGVAAERIKQEQIGQNQIAGIRALGEEQRKTQQEGANLGRYSRGSVSSMDAWRKATTFAAKANAALTLSQEALDLGDLKNARLWMNLHNQMKMADQEARAAGSSQIPAGRTDLDALQGGRIQSTPPRSVTPTTLPGLQPIENNPAVTPSQGSAAQQRKVLMVSPDGKVGNVPANQVQDALRQGYKIHKE